MSNYTVEVMGIYKTANLINECYAEKTTGGHGILYTSMEGVIEGLRARKGDMMTGTLVDEKLKNSMMTKQKLHLILVLGS